LYVHRPPGIAVAQLEPTEQEASVEQASPMVRVVATLQTPVSQISAAFLQSASDVQRDVGALSLEQAHIPRTTAAAAKIRIRTIPPWGA
jgi:hypothetical protein